MRYDLDYSLYLVTDRTLMRTKTLAEAVKQAISGGCTMIQLREKSASSLDIYQAARNVKAITEKHRIPLIINDRVDLALAVDAEGVHVGQSDLPAGVVRDLIGGDKLLGVSVSTAADAVKAEKDGADYLGVGAMYPTGTKTDAAIVSMGELKKIRSAVNLPIVVIGGINQKTVSDFKGTGINGLAVVSAVLSSENIVEAARELRDAFRRL